MLELNPLLCIDGYKSSHAPMYPPGISLVYSNYTCRSTKKMSSDAQDVVAIGSEFAMKYLKDFWQKYFFDRNKEEVINEAKEHLEKYLGSPFDTSHFEALHDLGYLPIHVKALPEGTIVGAGIPIFTIYNTNPDFFWITNFLETSLSTLIWKPIHSASIALAYRKIFTKYAIETGIPLDFVKFQGHDFSFRGMQSIESAVSSGIGFLSSFYSTDTIIALQGVSHYYPGENGLIGASVPASEHSVMCAHGKEGEIDTLLYLMNKYPTGILSVVSDTWDLWKLITEYLPAIKDKILARDGKLVIRPDSGDPVDIICGTYQPHHTDFAKRENPEHKGVIELLWDIFGGTINEQGYKVLDPHIGAIYGDSITIERAVQIAERLKAKGFANQVVMGIGSYSMGYATRDNQGGAVKSTYVEVNGEGRPIFKDPVTDDGTKKSKKGLLHVDRSGNGKITCFDEVSWEQEKTGLLETIFLDGELVRRTPFHEIRSKIDEYIVQRNS